MFVDGVMPDHTIMQYSNGVTIWQHVSMKSTRRRCKQCTLAVVRLRQKSLPCHRSPSLGHRTAKI